MLSDAIIVLIGTLVGSAITLLATYFNNRLTEEREERRTQMKLEEEAISQVFSPLVFVLEKTRNLFAKISALHATLQEMTETGDKPNEAALTAIYFTLQGVERYPQTFEDLLMHKSGLIKSHVFYADLVVLQSYLSTIVTFLAKLLLKSGEGPLDLKRNLSLLGPIVIQLDKAISGMREYSLAKTSRLPNWQYKRFFTEQKYSELESYINEVNRAMTGKDVPKWSSVLKRLSESENPEHPKEDGK